MYIHLKTRIKTVSNLGNIFLKKGNIIKGKKWCNDASFVDNAIKTEIFSTSHGFYFFNESFIKLFTKNRNKITYEMRRDRGGTIRKKLSREKKKTQKKQKKDSSKDVY
ncbi:conserved Plasmodium protein, unknown function [Plasmodium malariae]|uniref:Uncharacterized protein n=1 Tax=Plasmodium malariae TaxID=5858 RepID=A0A1C3K9Z3_PLAMA|nr:conserved Plasmodium protein, unknown function [Plasmodium malariae]